MVGHLRTSKVTPGDFDTLRRQELLREARAEDGKIEPFPKKGGGNKRPGKHGIDHLEYAHLEYMP